MWKPGTAKPKSKSKSSSNATLEESLAGVTMPKNIMKLRVWTFFAYFENRIQY